MEVVFGPIPSRRLGRSLGINNIPPKTCSYSCIYCQVGETQNTTTEKKRQHFYRPEYIFQQVKERLEYLKEQGETVDYLSFVPDGEPTLDVNLSQTIDKLRSLEIKIAVISNGSLIWRRDVRETLKKADWVSLKIDNIDETIWRRIDRANGNLRLTTILEGMLTFAKEYTGVLVTETMLVKSVNVDEHSAHKIADFLYELKPSKAYLLIPTRPPAEPTVRAPSREEFNRFYRIVSQKVPVVECLTNYEGNTFTSTGNIIEDLLSITAVHPMHEEAVHALLTKTQADWHVVENLMKEGKLKETEYEGNKFYVRRF